MASDSDKGWNFDNSYTKLPERFFAKMNPIAVRKPNIAIVNHELAKALGLILSDYSEKGLAALFSGGTYYTG